MEVCVLVWKENILKTERFEKDDFMMFSIDFEALNRCCYV